MSSTLNIISVIRLIELHHGRLLPSNQKSACQPFRRGNAAASLFTMQSRKAEDRPPLISPLWHFPANSAYPLRFWSPGWVGKKEALFRKQGIIRSNLSSAGAEKLVSSLRERSVGVRRGECLGEGGREGGTKRERWKQSSTDRPHIQSQHHEKLLALNVLLPLFLQIAKQKLQKRTVCFVFVIFYNF